MTRRHSCSSDHSSLFDVFHDEGMVHDHPSEKVYHLKKHNKAMKAMKSAQGKAVRGSKNNPRHVKKRRTARRRSNSDASIGSRSLSAGQVFMRMSSSGDFGRMSRKEGEKCKRMSASSRNKMRSGSARSLRSKN